LTSASVRRYRSIEDGSQIRIEPDVTCLVGKNESGKSAVLQALYKSHPVEKGVKFDPALDYPSRLTRERRRGDGPIPVSVLAYELDDEDLGVVESALGPGVLSSRTVTVTTGYDFVKPATTWIVQTDESAAAQHLKSGIELPASEQAALDAARTVADVVETLKRVEAPTAGVKSAIAAVSSWREGRLSLAVIDLLVPRRPQFVYFADYDIMPGKVSIPDLITKRDGGTLDRAEQAVVSLLEIADVRLEDFLTPESHEHLIRDAENASNSISEEVFEYWSQNKNLAVDIRPIDKAETDAVPPLNKAPLLQIRVENQRHRVTVPFDERSRGFVWFFSFLAYFSHLEDQAQQPLVLLLDEPGINLHASAQADLLRFIDERLAPNHQVIFTTHSPFMVDPHKLHRVRTVVDVDNEGTRVSDQVLHADAETAFPLHAALGVELAQTLFVAPDTLLVEGPSDVIYLEVLSNALRADGREGLDERWAVAPVGGAGKLAPFLTLLGANKLNVAVLADSSLQNSASIKALTSAGRLGSAKLVTIGDVTGADEADVEDLFEPGFYLALVNDAYAGAMSGVKLKVSDLPEDSRLVRRVERAFLAKGINNGRLNHFSPASALLRGQGKAGGKLDAGTLDRAEKLFRRINRHLA
jgi:AAA domain, putative AbiEii toxin, Type IV TA system/AAA ATPase domain